MAAPASSAPATTSSSSSTSITPLQKLLRIPYFKAKTGPDVPLSALEGKVIFLYFSASWCPACKGFTPRLVKLYRDMKAIANKETRANATEAQLALDPPSVLPFEIIFVSADSDEKAFSEYYQNMPWLAVPFAREKDRDRLSGRFRVGGIPSLAVINEKGKIASYNVSKKVLDENVRKHFPWIPPNIMTALESAHFSDRDPAATAASGSLGVTLEHFRKFEYLVVYFATIEDANSRRITPRIAAIYNAIKRKGVHSVEFLFVGLERDGDQHGAHWGELPFPGLVYHDPAAQDIVDACEVRRLPCVSVFKTVGGVSVNIDAVDLLDADPQGEFFPWNAKLQRGAHAAPYWALAPSAATLDALHNEICLIFSSNGTLTATAKQEFVRAASKIQSQWNAVVVDEDQQIRCFVVDSDTSPDIDAFYGNVLRAVGALRPPRGTPSVLAINIVEQKHEFINTSQTGGDLSEDVVFEFAKKFAEKFDAAKIAGADVIADKAPKTVAPDAAAASASGPTKS